MPNAPANKELGDMPADRLVFDKIDDYLHVIVARNLYSPANQPPKLAAAGTQRGFLNQRMSFSLKADDPEKNRITYRLGEDHPDGMTIDESTGRVEWTPEREGRIRRARVRRRRWVATQGDVHKQSSSKLPILLPQKIHRRHDRRLTMPSTRS